MKHIGDFFERYKTRLKPPQATVEKTCSEVIEEISNIKIETTQITYTVSTKTIHLQVPSIIKSELRLHNQKILKELKERLGEGSSPEVII